MNPLKIGSNLIILSGLLHFVAVALARFADDTLSLLVVGALYVGIGYFLKKGTSRLLQWIAFWVLIIFSIGALGALNLTHVPNWITLLIVVIDWLAILCLFVVLWKDFSNENTQKSPIL